MSEHRSSSNHSADNMVAAVPPVESKTERISCFSKICDFLKLLFGVELSVFLYCLANGIFIPAQQSFVYNKICMYKYDSVTVCSHIDTSASLVEQENAVQADYSLFSTYSTVTSSIPALFVTLIMGAWCDRFSFRIPLALPHLGSAVVTACYLLLAYLPIKTVNPVYWGVFSIFSGLGGSLGTIIMVCASYISHTTSGRNRTVRLGSIEASLTLGGTIGYLINAYILNDGGPVIAFAIQTAVNLYAIVFIFSAVRELHSFSHVKAKVTAEAGGSWFRFIFAPRKEVLNAFFIFFGKSEKYAAVRLHLILMLAVFFMVSAVGNGLFSVTFEFLALQPISFPSFYYAIFQAVSCIVVSFSLLVGMRVLRSYMKLTDAGFVVVGIVSRFLGFIALGLGAFYPNYVAWIYCVASMLAFYPYVSIRSGFSKLTDQSEHGRIFSVVSLVENGGSMLATLSFNALYGTLISTLLASETANYLIHGYTILFAAGLCIPALIVTIYLGRQGIKNWSFHSSLVGNLGSGQA